MTTTTPDLLGTVRRSPDGTRLAVLWPSPPHPARWMITDRWGSTGYETDKAVADWPVVGAVPCSPAAGMDLTGPTTAAGKKTKRYRITHAHLEDVAAVYLEARDDGKSPTRAVAEHFHISHSTAAKWVMHARRKGLLKPWTGHTR
ncbi:hypothetical protein ABZX40_13310 [Streptomyces sp. NPDC004610]|uniref:hypothetical protein n=1 Tax=unclassified Streptomyces TaxID=2593676 RepID=UPI0033B94FF0